MNPSSNASFPGRRALGAVGAVTLLVAALTGCTPEPPAPGASAASSPASAGDVRTVATGLQTPWSIVFLPDGTPLVSERDTGRIVQLASDGGRRTVATIDQVVHNGEGGLMGLAVRDGRLYAAMTTATDNRILRFAVQQTGGEVALGPGETVIDGLPTASFHNGGRIAFGPDGMLYITAGDAGRSSDAQDRTALGGKILRLQPDGSVPADNPFPDSPVYSFGHRNPQGIAWGTDGTMYAAEFGQNTWDELNVIRPGRNYGWPVVEGIADDSRFVDPVQQWRPDEASPSGIAVADDAVVIANLRGRSLRSVPIGDLSDADIRLSSRYGRIRDVAVGPNGDLWVLTSNTDGRGDPRQGDDRVLRIADGA